MAKPPRTYYETHRAIEEAKTADEVREIVRSFEPSITSPTDERQLMDATIRAICRLNGTSWREEIL